MWHCSLLLFSGSCCQTAGVTAAPCLRGLVVGEERIRPLNYFPHLELGALCFFQCINTLGWMTGRNPLPISFSDQESCALYKVTVWTVCLWFLCICNAASICTDTKNRCGLSTEKYLTRTTILWLLFRQPVSQHLQLRTWGFWWSKASLPACPLLMATGIPVFGLGRNHYSSPNLCYLRCLCTTYGKYSNRVKKKNNVNNAKGQ